jgi:hypothetical protein
LHSVSRRHYIKIYKVGARAAYIVITRALNHLILPNSYRTLPLGCHLRNSKNLRLQNGEWMWRLMKSAMWQCRLDLYLIYHGIIVGIKLIGSVCGCGRLRIVISLSQHQGKMGTERSISVDNVGFTPNYASQMTHGPHRTPTWNPAASLVSPVVRKTPSM